MAVISKIRKHSGLIVAAIGIAIIGFVVQDGLGNRRNRAPFIAEVGGEKVTYATFDQHVSQITEQYRNAQGGDVNLTPEDLTQIRNMAWERIVTGILMQKACDRMGLQVTPAEMNDMYYGEHISPILYQYFGNPATGEYDRQQVMMLISNFDQLSAEDRQVLSEVERIVKEERQKEKYYFMVAQGFYVPTAFAAELAHLRSDRAAAGFACLPYSEISDNDITLTDADYRRFYEENKHSLKQEKASVDIDYVSWDVMPTAADIADIERNAAEVYAELQTEEDIPDFVMTVSADRFDSVYKTRSEVEPGWDSLLFNAKPGTCFAPRRVLKSYQMAKLMDVQMRPDSLHGAHILIGFGANVQNRRDRDEARALADSLKRVLQAAPDRLAELAAAFSDDRSAAQNGGDLGWQKDGTFVAPFNQAMINGRVGDVTVVETMFGFHVLRIIDKTAPVKKVLACVISMPVEPSIETAKDVYAQASRFLSQCKNGADFDSVARQNGMRVRTATRVDELADQMPGLTNAREIVRWAYNKDNKAGDVAQEVFEMENRYVVATLKKRHKEGYMSLAELKEMPQLEYRIKRDAKANRLMDKAKAAEGKTNVAQVAEAWGVTPEQAEDVMFNGYSFGARGYEPALIGTLFGLNEGQLSKPVKGNSGVYVLASEGVTVGDGEPDMIRFQMMQMFQQRTFNFVRAALGEDYGIKDNRAMYF